jgi:hypothetical protein
VSLLSVFGKTNVNVNVDVNVTDKVFFNVTDKNLNVNIVYDLEI